MLGTLAGLLATATLAFPSGSRAADDDQVADVAAPPDGGPGESESEPSLPLNFNVKARTLGGRQLWGDVEYFHQWRIQENSYTGHCRLLDGSDVRYAWGTLAQCRQKLREVRAERKLLPMSGEAVILVHGIIRSSKSMRSLRKRLEAEESPFQTFGFDYPSTRVDIAESAEYLHRVIESLEGIERIHFVTHSMGGLVVRAYLQKHHDPRIGRMVMIAVPNRGADLADLFRDNLMYRAVFGPAGQQLSPEASEFIDKLPVPEFEFGIIAGGRGDDEGTNPLIPGDDDGTVSVESTRLPGARDFVVVDRLHTFVVSAPETAEFSLRFLKEGRFRDDGERRPIPPAPSRAARAGTAASSRQ